MDLCVITGCLMSQQTLQINNNRNIRYFNIIMCCKLFVMMLTSSMLEEEDLVLKYTRNKSDNSRIEGYIPLPPHTHTHTHQGLFQKSVYRTCILEHPKMKMLCKVT